MLDFVAYSRIPFAKTVLYGREFRELTLPIWKDAKGGEFRASSGKQGIRSDHEPACPKPRRSPRLTLLLGAGSRPRVSVP